jgi:hypothetical protein
VTKRIPVGRAQYLTVIGDGVYWLADARQPYRDQRPQYGRVERLDIRTGRVTEFASSGGRALFDGIAAGVDGLIVATETPVAAAACHGRPECMRPDVRLLRPSKPPHVLATSDPEILGAGTAGYLLVQVTQGALWKTIHGGRADVRLWRSTRTPALNLGDKLPGVFTVTVTGDALVAQLWGDRAIWTTSKTPLPHSIYSHSWQPAGSPTHLAWVASSANNASAGTVQLSTLDAGHFTTPNQIPTQGAIGSLDWFNDCQLLMEGRDAGTGNATGLFVADVCAAGTPVDRLLTADQAGQRDLSARWGLATGTLALAFKTGKAETIVVLRTPGSAR